MVVYYNTSCRIFALCVCLSLLKCKRKFYPKKIKENYVSPFSYQIMQILFAVGCWRVYVDFILILLRSHLSSIILYSIVSYGIFAWLTILCLRRVHIGNSCESRGALVEFLSCGQWIGRYSGFVGPSGSSRCYSQHSQLNFSTSDFRWISTFVILHLKKKWPPAAILLQVNFSHII